MPIKFKPIISIIFIIIAISIFSAWVFCNFNFNAIASIFKTDEIKLSENKLENKVLGTRIMAPQPRSARTMEPTSEPTEKNYPSLPLEKLEVIKNPKPIRNSEIPEIDINAKAAIIIDVATGEILYNKNIDEKLPIASLTKLMATLVVLDETNLNNIVIVSKDAIDTEGEKGSLEPGEKITVKNLLYALLVSSSNDSAIALAEYVSNNNRWLHSGDSPVEPFAQNESRISAPQPFGTMEPTVVKTESIFKFIELMNQKAIFLELENTNFSSPSGLDKEENYSTAYDLAYLAKFALDKPLIWEILRTQEIEISSSNGKIIHNLKNTNKLLGKFSNIAGGKTGFTDEAGECLILVVGDPIGNHQIISVVLNAQDRFSETEKLIQWTFGAYSWK